MAIYSFKMENISRGEGKSSVASAAYRHRKVFTDNRTGEFMVAKQHIKRTLPLRRFLHLKTPHLI
jgi:hypothetical protein